MKSLRTAIVLACVASIPIGLSKSHATDFSQVDASSPIVTISVLVTDRAGSPIGNLKQQAFRLFENGKQQTLISFSDQRVQLRYGLLADNSGSMRPKSATVQSAAKYLIGSHKPGDLGFLMSMSSGRVSLSASWTSDPNLLQTALDGIAPPSGSTGLLDAISKCSEIIASASTAEYRRALLLVSDGLDNQSAVKIDQLMRRLNKDDVQVFAIGLPPSKDADQGLFRVSPREKAMKLLDTITAETGGHVFYPKNMDELRTNCAQIMNCLRSEYVLGYQPVKPLDANSFREITVKVESGSEKYFVSARKHIGIPIS